MTNGQPRNRIRFKDLWEVFLYAFSPMTAKTIISKFGYLIHDHVAPRCQMHVKGNPRIHPTASLRCGYNIYLGENSHINQYCCIWASEKAKIVLGDNLLMGPGVKMFSSNHQTAATDLPMNVQPLVEKDIVVGDDVWIGANSVVTASVVIGKGAVIAAGSVVTRNIPEYTVAGGIPAKPIKSRCLK